MLLNKIVNLNQSKEEFSADRVACVILAGGKGTRLFPLTAHRSKPAVGFGGRYRLIDIPISNALNSGMNDIFVISQYFSTGLNEHIKNTYSLDRMQGGNLTLLSPEERPEGMIRYSGTADAVRKNLHALTKLRFDYILILSGDQLYGMDFNKMVRFAKEKRAALTIAALPVPEEDALRLGVLNIDDEATVIDFYEKPNDPMILNRFQLAEPFLAARDLDPGMPLFLASMGIYVFTKEALLTLLRDESGEDFGNDLIPKQMQRGKTSVFLHGGYWEDIGTVASFYYANIALTRTRSGPNFYDEKIPIYSYQHYLPGAYLKGTRITGSIICDGSILEAEEITNSIIGTRSVIGKGTIIRDSILLGNESYHAGRTESAVRFRIGEECILEKAVVDENVVIGNGVRLINTKGADRYDKEGIHIRDGIIVVPSNARIPDGFTL
ncbi:MAG: sugar phosphate nucleotidyltransferase [Simkaniaceae bacterium]|nr:sugar phosphate nucleotidyltransferase [Simkaniaceae bacterium]